MTNLRIDPRFEFVKNEVAKANACTSEMQALSISLSAAKEANNLDLMKSLLLNLAELYQEIKSLDIN